MGIVLTPDPAWVALSLVEHVGAKKLRALADAFDGDLDAALQADAQRLQRVPGIGPKIAAAIRAVDLPAVAPAIPRWRDAGITLLTLDDPAYPAALRVARRRAADAVRARDVARGARGRGRRHALARRAQPRTPPGRSALNWRSAAFR